MLNNAEKRRALEKASTRHVNKAVIAKQKAINTGSDFSRKAAETHFFLSEVCLKEAFICQNQNAFESMLLFAMRYALPRQSTAPSSVQAFLTNMLPYLSVETIQKMAKDLEQAKQDSAKSGGFPYAMGDPTIDRPGWLKFQTAVQHELQKRQKGESES